MAAAYLSRLLSITFGQNVIVVDASILAVALGDDGTDGERARERLAGETLVAPELVDLEVVSVWRRHVAAKLMPARRAASALADLVDLPLRRSSHQPFLNRIWELRHVVTGHGPKTAERLEFRRLSREETAWVRRALLAEAA